MNRCLYCYLQLEEGQIDFHAACSRAIFGQEAPPDLPFSEKDLETLAAEVIKRHKAVPGVQPKLSVHHHSAREYPPSGRFTIVGLWGEWILKTPSPVYSQLPEVEDLTMNLASLSGLATAPHTLIRLSSGNLAYITRRIDRRKNEKLAMEDMCQLTERLTEDKYRGSYEQIGKAILRYSATPGLDLINFSELLLFCFLTGNADMHLKNFSLLEQPEIGDGSLMTLSPAYDLINTALVNPHDKEEMALTLNGKRNRIERKDLEVFMDGLKLDKRQQKNIFRRIQDSFHRWNDHISNSFLTEENKKLYRNILTERISRIY